MSEITHQIAPTPIEVHEVSHARRCRHTGVTFPECSCLHCNRGKLRRYAPAQVETGRASQSSSRDSRSGLPHRPGPARPHQDPAGGALLPIPVPGRADPYLHEEKPWLPRSAPN